MMNLRSSLKAHNLKENLKLINFFFFSKLTKLEDPTNKKI